MSDSYTVNVGLTLMATGDTNWGVVLNAQLAALDALGAIGPLAVAPTEYPSASLNVKVAAGSFRQAAGPLGSYAGTASRGLTASATNYLYLTDAGTLTVNTTGFPAGVAIVPLATAVTGTAAVTSVADGRVPWMSLGTNEPPVFGGSGASHSQGAVPDPGASAGTTRYLREDGTWTAPPGSGTVSSVGLALPPALFAVTGSPVTTSGTLSAALDNQGVNTFFAGPVTGPAAAPTFRAIQSADLPVMGASGAGHAPGAVPDPGGSAGSSRYLREDGTWDLPAGSGTVLSVALSLPGDFTVTGSPITGSGTLTAAYATQGANTTFAGPTSGSPAAPTFRALVGADLPVMGASGASHSPGAVPDPGATAGTTRYLREDGTWTIPPGGGGGSMAIGGAITGATAFDLLGVDGAGNLGQTALTGVVYSSGAGFAAATGANLPVMGASGASHSPGAVPDPGATAGTTRYLREDGTWTAPPGAVTSVALTAPSFLAVGGSPITGSGTLALSLATQTVGLVFAGPSAGGAAAPTFRALAAADVPALDAAKVTTGTIATARLGSGTASSANFLRGDGTWSSPTATPSFTTTAPSGWPYTASTSDCVILVDTSAARTVTLPTAGSAGNGKVVCVKDKNGSAFTNNVTVNVASSGTIDGASSLKLVTNYGELEFVSDGTVWRTKGNRPDYCAGNLTVADALLCAGNLSLTTVGQNTQTFTLAVNWSVNLIQYTGAGAVTANLPAASAAPGAGYLLIIKDVAGTAAGHNIAVTPHGTDTIDGANAAVSITTNYGVLRLLCDGVSAWYAI